MMNDQAENLREMVRDQNKIDIKSEYSRSKVISVSSGKGGVGKSNFVINLAYNFSLLGKKVVIIDADLGLANVEVLFGVIPQKNLGHILYEELSISKALTDGPNGIKFLSGGSGISELSRVTTREQKRVIDCFNYLDSIFDIILIDTGAGISDLVVNFNKAATDSIVIATPEPTSITDAYALIKILKDEYAKDERELKVNLVINKTDDDEEGDYVFKKLNAVCNKFLNIELSLLGYLPSDLSLITSVKKQSPVSVLYPDSEYSKAIKKIAYKVLEIEQREDKIESVSVESTFASRLLKFFGRK